MPALPPIPNDIGEDNPSCPLPPGGTPFRIRAVLTGIQDTFTSETLPDVTYLLFQIELNRYFGENFESFFLPRVWFYPLNPFTGLSQGLINVGVSESSVAWRARGFPGCRYEGSFPDLEGRARRFRFGEAILEIF